MSNGKAIPAVVRQRAVVQALGFNPCSHLRPALSLHAMRKLLLSLILLLSIAELSAQIGIGTRSPQPTAILELKSTNRGVLLPRMRTEDRERIQNPADGLIIFNIDTRCYEVFLKGSPATGAQGRWDNYCSPKRFAALKLGKGKPDPSTLLDVASTTQGILLPRLTTPERNAIKGPAVGLMIFNIDSKCYQVYVGAAQARADQEGWDDYCVQTHYDSLLIGQGSLSSSAVLEVRSTSQGVLFPRMRTDQRDAIQTPVVGLTIFNTDSLCYEVYLKSKIWDDYCKRRDPKLASLRIGTDSLTSSAILEASATDRGVLLPRMNTAQRDAIQTPAAGLTIFNLDSLCYQVYLNGKGWDDYCHRQQLHSLVVGSDSLDSSAILEISATDKGVLLPRMTTAQRDAIQNKVLGLTVFNTDSACYEAYVGLGQPKWADSKGWDDYCVQTYYDSLLIGQGSLSSSAVLEVRSTSQGVLLPRMTTDQRNAIQKPAAGLTIFNLDSLCYEVYRGAAVQPSWDDYCKRRDPKLASLRIGTDSLGSSAIVSVSATAKGVLLPRMTTAQRDLIQSPVAGLTIFNKDSLCYQVYLNGKSWDDYCHQQQLHSLVVGSDVLDSSAILEISATDKGVLLPRMTTAQRDDIQDKVLGLTVFNIDSACYEAYVGLGQPKWADSKGWDDYCVQTYYDSLLIGQGSLSSSAVLEVRSAKGVLLPRMTTAQRDLIQSPAAGLTIFNKDSLCYEVYLKSKIWDDYCKRVDPKLASLRIGTDSLGSSAIVSVSATAKGVLLPRMTTAQRDLIQSPVAGLTIFNKDSLCYQVYLNGKGWDDYCHRQQLHSILVGLGTLSPSAILEISATDKGVLLPRMTTAQRDAIQNKVLGLTVFNTDSACYEAYVGLGQPKWADSKGWDDYCVQTYYDSLLIGQGSLSPSAILEISATAKGVLLPRMTTAQRDLIQSPAAGLTIFNKDSLCYEVYRGAAAQPPWDDYCKRRDPKLASLRIGTDSLASSAILEISATVKGVLLPRMTTAQRDLIQSPAAGLTIFNLDSLCYQVYLNGKGWDDYCHRQQLHSLLVGSGALSSSAILEISATNKGVLLPRMTTAQRDDIQDKVLGLTVFNTDSACYEAYVGLGQPKWADSKGWDNYCVQTYYDSLLIGSGTLSPAAILALRSTTKGVLLPRMRTSERDAIANPPEGLMIFNVETRCLESYKWYKKRQMGVWTDYCNQFRLPSLKIGPGSLLPDAILDVESTSKGVLLPRMTTAERDAIQSPEKSLLIFNTSTRCYNAYIGRDASNRPLWSDYCNRSHFDSLYVNSRGGQTAALLDVQSTSKGILLPRMTTAQRDAIQQPTSGLTIFNLDSLCYQVYVTKTGGRGVWDDYCSRKYFKLDSLTIGTTNLDSAAIVSLASSRKGVLFPRMNEGARDAISPLVIGLTLYNTDRDCYQVYIGVGRRGADASGWDDYCKKSRFDSLLLGSGTRDSSAILQVNSDDKGILLPILTTAQRDSIKSPEDGLMIYNFDRECYEFYAKSATPGTWKPFCKNSHVRSLAVGTRSLQSAAILEVRSTNKGILFPRMTNFQRDGIVNPVIGLTIYNLDSHCYQVYTGVGGQGAGQSAWDDYCDQNSFDSLLVGSGSLDSSAILEVSSVSKGVLLPRMTTAQRDAIAVDSAQSIGLTIYNLDSLCYQVYARRDKNKQPRWDDYCSPRRLESLRIGIDKLEPPAILEVTSSSKGVLFPRMTTVQRDDKIKNLVNGLTIFNTTIQCFQVYVGKGSQRVDAMGWDNYCSQVNLDSLRIGTDSLHASAILAVVSSNKGVLFPRMTTLQRNDNIQNPSQGLTIYNLDEHCYQVYMGVGLPRADGAGWDDYCDRKDFDSLLVGVGTKDPAAISSISTTDRGVLLPRMTTQERNAIKAPVAGLLIYNLDSHCYQVYVGVGQAQADAIGWDEYCTTNYYDSLLVGQGALGSTSILAVNTISKGVLFSAMNTTQRNNIVDPEEGLTIFNTDNLCYQVYIGIGQAQADTTGWDDYCSIKPASLKLGTGKRNPAAALDVESTTRGVLFPILTTDQRNAIDNPAVGLTIFNHTTNCYEVYIGKGIRQADAQGWDNYCDLGGGHLSSLKLGTGVFHPAAILQVNSKSRGVLLTRMTTQERNAIVNPADGLMIFNTDTQCYEMFVASLPGHFQGNKWFNYCTQTLESDPPTTKDNPGRDCYQIHRDKPTAPNGEYWIKPLATDSAFKTYCDMEHGGFTLVWSYAENTNYGSYLQASSFQQAVTLSLSNNQVRNFASAKIGKVTYADYRISLDAMQAINRRMQYHVRVTDKPTDMDDPYAQDNNLYIKVELPGRDFLQTTFAAQQFYTYGKILGKNLLADPISGQASYDSIQGLPMPQWISGQSSGTALRWENSNNIFLNATNFFGGFKSSENAVSMFGSCGPTSTGGATQCAASALRVQKNINSGYGRYLQWFVR